MDDDAWHDDDSVPEEAELDRECRIRHERAAKKGFREGVTEGTDVRQHAGFVAGYRSGLSKAKLVGFLEGCIAVRQLLIDGSAQAQADAVSSVRTAHAQLKAHHSGEDTPPVNIDLGGHENQHVTANIPAMGSIAEEEPLGEAMDTSQHLLQAQTVVKGFAYGPFPTSVG